ncbi:MAG: ankyrin repeat domain-containing protein [Planctomycetota bacterium]
MNNLKGHLVLIGVAALGVALILVAILLPPGEIEVPEDPSQSQQQTEQQGESQALPTGGTGSDAERQTIEPTDDPAHVRLMRAASAGDTRTIAGLVGMGVGVDTTASAEDARTVLMPPLEIGMTALMLAARDSDQATVTALLEAGADPNAIAQSGSTPLMFAAQRGQTDQVVALLGAGADPTRSNAEGRTALMLAARSGAHEAASLLIEAGADADATDRDGATALMHAAGGQHMEAVLVLLGGGADPLAVDGRGRGALDRAGESGPVAEILREAAGG